MSITLNELSEAILTSIKAKKMTKASLMKSYVSSRFDDDNVSDAIEVLVEDLGYIEEKRALKSGFYALGERFTEDDYEKRFAITELGKAYLSRQNTGVSTHYSNITNSNIAHQSSSASQTISLAEQSEDIREKIQELEAAIKKKDSASIKRAFGYIADKSVDVAIAVVTGALLR